MQPEIAEQDTRAVAALICSPARKEGQMLWDEGERALWFASGEPGSGEAWSLGMDCA